MSNIKTLSQVRSTFLDFFAKNNHEVLQSSPLVPQSDPTLMFTNAGMVPFKHIFAGKEVLRDKQGAPISRAASSQKCVRAGGKHNDLENVGYTARHHTFFEMLGNFSFGDYFKEDAIALAWQLLTREFGLPADRLYVTTYHTDNEARDIWRKVSGLSDSRIIPISTDDNFWSMGDTGPCGPCSEIFYDHGEHIEGGLPGTPQEDGDRFVEIWNLVFMQYNQGENGRAPLPKPSIDTGMGLERMAAVMQGVHDNYDTDIFRNLISACRDISRTEGHEASHRVIADHLRASAFLIADGVLPAGDGRGYVLRRIMRRAMRHVNLLGVKDAMMHRLVVELITQMGGAYPELSRARSLIEQTLRTEEERFMQTLDRGLALLREHTADMRASEVLSGEVAFKLYDTYGFPLDLTQDILRAEGITVDGTAFDTAMAHQKERARASWSGSGAQAADTLWLELAGKYGATQFTGYTALEGEAQVRAMVHDGQEVEALTAGQEAIIITDKTPFYAESGGQAGDRGQAMRGGRAVAEVTDTKKQQGLHLHHVRALEDIAIGETLNMQVDCARRNALKANHSATHLLHASLRKHLGEQVTQKGSLVEADYFRFDFSYAGAVEAQQIALIEAEVNAVINAGGDVETVEESPEQAIERGAMALFGEKYGDRVRVVSMGGGHSCELCGGTHVARLGDIGLFVITRESSVASGVRRIEALTGRAAYEYLTAQRRMLEDVCAQMKATPAELPARIAKMKTEQQELKSQIKQLKAQLATGGASRDDDTPEELAGGVQFIGKVLDGVSPKELRGIADGYKDKIRGVVVLVAVDAGKAALVVGISKDIAGRLDAVELVRAGVGAIGGKGGGGRVDFAQAGGSNASGARAAIDDIKALLASNL